MMDRGPIPPAFFLRDTAAVARDLLGSLVRSSVGGQVVEGIIVEAEAYVGPHDPASHAAERIGRTPRNKSMFGAAGTAYVYRSHGVHWCLNVVTGEEGFPAAVLLRGVEVVRGAEVARARREHREPLGAGPGRLCQALDVTGSLDGHPLSLPPLELRGGWDVPDGAVAVSGRVGISSAADWPLRFYVRGHSQVSRGPKEITRGAL
jgi:DNA-3-methyladenine glycosylase